LSAKESVEKLNNRITNITIIFIKFLSRMPLKRVL